VSTMQHTHRSVCNTDSVTLCTVTITTHNDTQLHNVAPCRYLIKWLHVGIYLSAVRLDLEPTRARSGSRSRSQAGSRSTRAISLSLEGESAYTGMG